MDEPAVTVPEIIEAATAAKEWYIACRYCDATLDVLDRVPLCYQDEDHEFVLFTPLPAYLIPRPAGQASTATGTGERCPTCGSDQADYRAGQDDTGSYLCGDPWHAGPATEETT